VHSQAQVRLCNTPKLTVSHELSLTSRLAV